MCFSSKLKSGDANGSEVAETDGVLGFGTDDGVAERACRHHDATTLVVRQIDGLVLVVVGVFDDGAGHILNAEFNIHGCSFVIMRNACARVCTGYVRLFYA